MARLLPPARSGPARLEAPRPSWDRGYDPKAPLTLPIEAMIDLRQDSEVRCEPEPQRWRVFQDGRLVGYLTRLAPEVRMTVEHGRLAAEAPRRSPGPLPLRDPHGR